MTSVDVKLLAITTALAQRCGACRHFRKNPQVIGQGLCFWGPPQAVPVMAGDVPSIMSARPPVSANDSCGQWESSDAAKA